MSSDPTSTQGQTGSSADDLVLPNFGPAISFIQSFAGNVQEQLDRIHNLPAMHDGARWVQLSTRVDDHQNRLITFQRTVTDTEVEVRTLRNEVTTLQNEVTTLGDENATFRAELAALRRDNSGTEQNVLRFQGDMGSLREEFTAFRERLLPLGQQMRSLSATTANETVRLTDSISVRNRDGTMLSGTGLGRLELLAGLWDLAPVT
ncbi:hypothetical protein E4U49_005372 [Claviceps purpurea]|nr:hypothetical protein E4U49_005372 [Claviceps purpurea]